jgi:hypothetical protein
MSDEEMKDRRKFDMLAFQSKMEDRIMIACEVVMFVLVIWVGYEVFK